MSRRYTPKYRRDERERLPTVAYRKGEPPVPNLPWRNWTDEEVDRAIAAAAAEEREEP